LLAVAAPGRWAPFTARRDTRLATFTRHFRSWRLRRRAAGPRSLLGGIPASRRSLVIPAPGACGAGPLGPVHCSAGYPPRDVHSSFPLLAPAAPGRWAPFTVRRDTRLATFTH